MTRESVEEKARRPSTGDGWVVQSGVSASKED